MTNCGMVEALFDFKLQLWLQELSWSNSSGWKIRRRLKGDEY